MFQRMFRELDFLPRNSAEGIDSSLNDPRNVPECSAVGTLKEMIAAMFSPDFSPAFRRSFVRKELLVPRKARGTSRFQRLIATTQSGTNHNDPS